MIPTNDITAWAHGAPWPTPDQGYDVRAKMSAQPKVYLRYTAESGTTRKIKVEVNTHERSPATSTVRLPYGVTSNWWSSQADVRTFSLAGLVATKIRALYQRRKGS